MVLHGIWKWGRLSVKPEVASSSLVTPATIESKAYAICISLFFGLSSECRLWPKDGQSDQNRNNAIRIRCPLDRRRHPQGLKAGLGEPENNVVSYKFLQASSIDAIHHPLMLISPNGSFPLGFSTRPLPTAAPGLWRFDRHRCSIDIAGQR